MVRRYGIRKMPLTKSMSSSDIRKLIRETAGSVMAFIAQDSAALHRYRVYLSENGKAVMPTAETKEVLEASARYFNSGGVIWEPKSQEKSKSYIPRP